MRRICTLLCLMAFLALPVRAEQTKYVALTFDDGPSGKFTRLLLEGLYEREAKATFLLCGYRIQQYPELTAQIFEEGHEIGLHGFSHDSMRSMSRRGIGQELMASEALMPEGCKPVFFRPPGGFCTDGVRQVAQARQLAILSWSVDPKDWATEKRGAVEAAVLEKVRDGDIVLLHDMTMNSVRAAFAIIDTLREQGFEFVTVSELAKLRGEKIRPGQMYTHFPIKEMESGK